MTPTPPAAVLALDSSTEQLALGLCTPTAGLRHRLLPGAAQASASVLPQLLQLLAEAGCAPSDLQAVAYGRGPGAFTGLRTACAVAQGLALGLGCPLLAIDSLLIVAEDARQQARDRAAAARADADAAAAAAAVDTAVDVDVEADFDVWVALDARMDEVYAARYRWQPGLGWTVRAEAALYTPQALGSLWAQQPPLAVAGQAPALWGAQLPTGSAPLYPAEHDRAAALLRLALAAWQQGAPRLDAADALPLYLRDKVALTTAERLAAKALQPPPAGTPAAAA